MCAPWIALVRIGAAFFLKIIIIIIIFFVLLLYCKMEPWIMSCDLIIIIVIITIIIIFTLKLKENTHRWLQQGTLGTQANTAVCLPHLTRSYSEGAVAGETQVSGDT